MNLESTYSYICRNEKYPPKIIVIKRLLFICLKLLVKSLWCAQVTAIPEDNKIIVFNKGILKGLNLSIPRGGQQRPNSIVEDKLEWKKAQKKEIKKKISDTINKIIPNFKPTRTFFVCSPWNVLSRATSRHHWNIVNKITIKPIIIKNFLLFKWYSFTTLTNVSMAPIAPVRGQAL